MAKEGIVVPVIDLANFPAELEKLASASTEVGCFQVINHGIPLALLAEMKETARSLFELPEEVKRRNVNHNVIDGRYRPRNFEPNGKYHESFSIYNAALPSDVLSFCSALDVSPQQRKVITDYFGKLYGLILEMASKVVESLGLVGRSFEEWSCQARVMSYKFTCQEDIGCIAAPLHTDSSFLTVLQADECVGGLQIIDASGNFIDVDPLPGAIFVNLGDMGKVWSNGRLHTVKHRVVCKEVTTRFSIGLFLLAPKDGYIGTEPAFIDAEHPKLYQNFIYNEYRKQRNKCEYKIGDLALRVFKADHELSSGISLGLNGCSFKDWFCQARLISYKFACQEDVGGIGVPPHTDSSFLTVLQVDDCVGGLEIMDANANFIDMDPLPGTLFVNIGDIGKVWSNGRLQSLRHRVVCKKAMPRISIALFLLAPKHGSIETQPAFIDTDHPKLYKTFNYNVYRKQMKIKATSSMSDI